MPSSQKKAVLRLLNGDVSWGYIAANGFVEGDQVALLDPSGKVTTFPLNEIRWIAYVKDFNLNDRIDPERMGRNTFQGRPRQGGLWVRLTLAGEHVMEGVADFELPALDALIGDRGLTLTPPDRRSNTMRLFVPRSAIVALEVLGWIGASAKKPAAAPSRPTGEAEEQPGLFES